MYRGAAYDRKGDRDRGVADATKASELDPKQAAGFTNRAITEMSKGDFDTAIVDATKTIENDPKSAPAYGARGAAREAQGDYNLAIADYAKLAEMEPENFWHTRALGLLRFVKGDFEGASADLLRVLELRYDVYAVLFRYLARAHVGENEAAMAELADNARRWKARGWPAASSNSISERVRPTPCSPRRSDRATAAWHSSMLENGMR